MEEWQIILSLWANAKRYARSFSYRLFANILTVVQYQFLQRESLLFLAILLPCLVFSVLRAAEGINSTVSEVLLSQPLTIRWRYESSITLNLTPAFDRERIYLPLAGGTIVSLKATDGQLYWRSDMGGELSASPVADESMVYVASETVGSDGEAHRSAGALRALGREAGVTQWMTSLVKPLLG